MNSILTIGAIGRSHKTSHGFNRRYRLRWPCKTTNPVLLKAGELTPVDKRNSGYWCSQTRTGTHGEVGPVVPSDKITGRVAGVAEAALTLGAAKCA